MRIISEFRDYYDGVQNQGIDKEVIYNREQKLLPIEQDKATYFLTRGKWTLTLRVLGFCGDIYREYSLKHEGLEAEIFYDYELVKSRLLEIGFYNNSDFKRDWLRPKIIDFKEMNLDKYKELFHKHQVPIFKITRLDGKQVLALNPILKATNFQRIKDPFTAYQEIFQFVSGVLNSPENKMVVISDKDKISKHGFDKWSFRKHKNDKSSKS